MKKQHPDEYLNNRIKEAKTVRKVVFFTITFLLLFFVVTGVMTYLYISSSLEAVDPDSDEEIELEIPLGSTSTQIAQILKENNLIKDERIFKFYIKFKNETNFQAGQYTLSPSLTLKETIKELQSGKLIEEPIKRVTIPEGKTVEEIAAILEKRLSITQDEFLDLIHDEQFLEEMIEQFSFLLSEDILDEDLYVPLEGYLFAGTYDIFDEDITPEQMIFMMLERTNEILLEKTDEIEESEFNVHEILTLASVIEREAKFTEDRPKVSQVYLNRLNENMRLQSDITAFYGLQHKAVVTYEDVEIDTPYNTYVIDGLPIGPINSPSIESIYAVLEPEGDDFEKLYYFSRPSGETFYSDTLEQHNEIKNEYRQEWYDLENEKES